MVIPLAPLKEHQTVLATLTKILHTTVNPLNDTFGQITGGCITLQGPLFPVYRAAYQRGIQYSNLKRAEGYHGIADYPIWLDGIRSYSPREDKGLLPYAGNLQ